MKKIFIVIFFFSSLVTFSQKEYRILKNPANVRTHPVLKPKTLIKRIDNSPLVIIEIKQSKFSFVKNPSDRSSSGKSKKYWVSNSRMFEAAVLNKDANIRWNPTLKPGDVIKQYPKGKAIIVIKKEKTQSGVFVWFQDPIDGGKRWIHESTLDFAVKTNVSTEIKTPVTKVVQKNVVPNCDYIITYPTNGSNNIFTNPTIKWKHGTGNPKGYYFTIATSVNGKLKYVKTKDGRLIRQLNIGYVNSYSLEDLKPFTTYKLGLLPYNDIGLAIDCDGLFSFTTGSSGATSEQIIEKRLKKMGILWKWRSFKKINNQRVVINDVDKFIDSAMRFKGAPHGGTNNWNGIDCSGLIYRGLQGDGNNSIKLNAQNYAASGRPIAYKSSLRRGDLVAFTNTIPGKKELIHHIGIYVGNNKFLHSSSSKGVIFSDINDPFFWGDKFIFGVRY